jgi:ssRNA-specific RNase YbeY (16S rRNA maturation enzyme)
METIIKVIPSELDSKLLDRIRDFIAGKENIDITISLKVMDESYMKTLHHSIEEAEHNRDIVSFTMEDFMSYAPAPDKGA